MGKRPTCLTEIIPPPPVKKSGKETLLFVDWFARYLEPENARAARSVLEAGGYTVLEDTSSRPLCCGRTFLSAGLVDQAREELSRLVGALSAHAQRGVQIVGLEPSCLLTLRDELRVVLNDAATEAIAKQSVLFEEFLVGEAKRGELKLPLQKNGPREAYLHGHCHQKALGTMPEVVAALQLVPGLSVRLIDSRCCGMAGAFAYEAKHYDIPIKMPEPTLLPAFPKPHTQP